MDVTSINDLPNEIIENFLMIYLSPNDVFSFGMTGTKRFKEIADITLEKRSKLTSQMLYNIILLSKLF